MSNKKEEKVEKGFVPQKPPKKPEHVEEGFVPPPRRRNLLQNLLMIRNDVVILTPPNSKQKGYQNFPESGQVGTSFTSDTLNPPTSQ